MGFLDVSRAGGRASPGYYDEGLRRYMLGVYNYMASALGLSGLVAYIVYAVPSLLHFVHSTPMHWVVMFSPIILSVVMSARIGTMSMGAVHACFWLFATSMGASLSSLFVVYTGGSIARLFFISASVFGLMSIYGYSTKRDLSGIGSFLIMGLIGVVLASIVNIFVHSTGLLFATSIIGVLVFIGLTAYDVQRIKQVYYNYSGMDSSAAQKISIMGALSLYLNFINLFVSLLHLMGERK